MSDTFHPYPHVPKVYPPGKPAGAATQHVPVLIVGGGPWAWPRPWAWPATACAPC